MRFQVITSRMPWPAGTVLGTEALAGCNIEALVQGGHLGLVPDQPTKKRTPVVTVPETADEPKEQD
jgi:hypothetical protein